MTGTPEVPAPPLDNWEQHWTSFADITSDNPAQAFRRELIIQRILRCGSPRHLLDIGSGQGDLLASLDQGLPASVELAGLELSTEGIRRSAEKVPRARYFQIDLIRAGAAPRSLDGWADVAVCSEVLEHVDEPARLLRAASTAMQPRALLIVTVPGGPRSAFDRYIGHRRHFTPHTLKDVLVDAGFDVEHVTGTGFPFFNLYKLVVLARGNALVRDAAVDTPTSRLATMAMRLFGRVLRPQMNASRFGWQLVAVARRPSDLSS